MTVTAANTATTGYPVQSFPSHGLPIYRYPLKHHTDLYCMQTVERSQTDYFDEQLDLGWKEMYSWNSCHDFDTVASYYCDWSHFDDCCMCFSDVGDDCFG